MKYLMFDWKTFKTEIIFRRKQCQMEEAEERDHLRTIKKINETENAQSKCTERTKVWSEAVAASCTEHLPNPLSCLLLALLLSALSCLQPHQINPASGFYLASSETN